MIRFYIDAFFHRIDAVSRLLALAPDPCRLSPALNFISLRSETNRRLWYHPETRQPGIMVISNGTRQKLAQTFSNMVFPLRKLLRHSQTHWPSTHRIDTYQGGWS